MISENYNMDIENHKKGSRIAGDSTSIFKRDFGENDDKINEELSNDQEDDPENDTLVIDQGLRHSTKFYKDSVNLKLNRNTFVMEPELYRYNVNTV